MDTIRLHAVLEEQNRVIESLQYKPAALLLSPEAWAAWVECLGRKQEPAHLTDMYPLMPAVHIVRGMSDQKHHVILSIEDGFYLGMLAGPTPVLNAIRDVAREDSQLCIDWETQNGRGVFKAFCARSQLPRAQRALALACPTVCNIEGFE